jgi:hypothetical protein
MNIVLMKKDRPMEQRCALPDDQLLDYIQGSAAADLCAMIEQTPSCLSAARRLAAELQALKRLLHRISCPSPEVLIDYQERTLEGMQQLVVRQHLLTCPLCQEEYELLGAIDAIPLTPEPGRVRRFFEALFQSPLGLPQPARGQVLHYRIPHLAINLSPRRVEGQGRTWTLRGQVRTAEGEQVAGLVESVLLRAHADAAVLYEGSVELNGSFLLRGIPEGDYSLTVTTSAEEILIRQLTIGDGA